MLVRARKRKKAPDRRVPKAVHETQQHWEHAYRDLAETLGANLHAWLGHRFRGSSFLTRSARRPSRGHHVPHPAPVLTAEDLAELVALIEMHFDFPAAKLTRTDWSLPVEHARKWKRLGIVAPGVDISRLVRDPFVAGQLHRVIKQGTTLAEMRKLAMRHPMPRHMQLAVEFGEQQAARWVTAFGRNLADHAVTEAVKTNRQLAQGMISRYLDGELKAEYIESPWVHSSMGHAMLTPMERATLESDRIVQGWRSLASELYHTFKGTDAARDWNRVGWTETQSAYQHGVIHGIAESDGPRTLIW